MKEINISDYRINHYSQCGEDGIIEKLFEIANIKDGWLIEFGASDGVWLSNTHYHFLKNKTGNTDYKLLLIEPDIDKYNLGIFNTAGEENVIYLNKKVELEGENSLNEILKKENIYNISLLSIDVDGIDLDIWNSLDKQLFRPKIVIIECYGWEDNNRINHLNECFENCGYDIICVTGNFIFIRKDMGIKSLHNIYELAKTSGHPDYNYSNKKITHAEYDDIASKMHHPSLFPDIMKTLAQPQMIQYDF